MVGAGEGDIPEVVTEAEDASSLCTATAAARLATMTSVRVGKAVGRGCLACWVAV
jgi:hypothetical protein